MIKKRYIFIAVMIIILIGLYAGGVWYYRDHLFRDTKANSYSLSNMTVEEAERTFVKDLAAHQIKVIKKEGTEILPASEAGITIDIGNQIKDLKLSQNYWQWPLHFFGSSTSDVQLKISYDPAKVTALVNQMDCFKKENITAPEDAYIDAGVSAFAIVPEVMGNTVKKNELLKKVEEAFQTGITEIDLEKEGLYVVPEHYAEDADIKEGLDKANFYSHSSITYDYIYKKDTLGYDILKNWIKIGKNYAISLDQSLAGDYVADMQKKYNTMGVARKFKTANGDQITIVQGDYGWKVDFKKEKKQLLKDVKAGKAIEREPVWEYRGLVRKGERDDIGKTYVEVSIKDQTVWMFDKGKCVASSSCVTGNPRKKASTTKGIYSITFKKSPATLTGPNAQGGHYSSDVTYWMPFNGNQGLHDAPWRKSFGGNIYKSNGSHGCVNLPFDMAEAIWKHVKEGYPVIVY